MTAEWMLCAASNLSMLPGSCTDQMGLMFSLHISSLRSARGDARGFINTMAHAGRQLKMAYELCLAPGEQGLSPAGPNATSRSALLTNSALGSTHWLTLSSDQVILPTLYTWSSTDRHEALASKCICNWCYSMEQSHRLPVREKAEGCVIHNSVNSAVLAGGRACSHCSLRRKCRGAGRLWCS